MSKQALEQKEQERKDKLKFKQREARKRERGQVGHVETCCNVPAHV
jgi:hypothetical protein